MKNNYLSLLLNSMFLGFFACCMFQDVNAQLPVLKQCTPTLIPAFVFPCGSATNWAYIKSLTTTGGNNNITNNNTNCGNTATSYSDYTGTTMFVKQNALSTVDVNITWAGNVANNIIYTLTKIYIDWDRNGYFNDTDEYISPGPYSGPHPHSQLISSTTQTHTLTIKVTVPGHAKEGQTRMRVITSSTGPVYDPFVTACNGNRGEAEDYVFEVVNPCMPPNVISVANLNYKSADFAWTPKLNAEFYEYIITPVDTIPHDTVSGFTFTTNTSVDVDTFKCDTKYYIMVRVVCDTVGKIARDWKRSGWVRDSFTTDPCCYSPVLTVDNVTSTTARVQWDPIPTSFGYEYAVSTTPEPPQQGTFTVNTTVLLQGLQSKTTHFVHVRSRCTPTPLSDWSKAGFKSWQSLSVNTSAADKFFSMNVYPNPARDVLTVQLNGKPGNNGRIELIDLNGKILYSAPALTLITTIDIDDISKFIYIIIYT